jgi:hypothetical protein
LAEKAADKAGSSIRVAQDSAKDVGNVGKQGLITIADMVSQARDVASNAAESIVAYTKNNPVKALAIAAASGALLYAAIQALSPSRD